MLFCYPTEATGENWLHDGLVAILTRALKGEAKPLLNWLGVFPKEKHPELKRKTSLLPALKKVVEGIGGLDHSMRAALLECVEAQNRLPAVFDPSVVVPPVPMCDENFFADLKALFELGFRLLTPTGVRDRQYTLAYNGIPAPVCAFCGIERLASPHPEIPRESLDHYLAMTHYPFAGVNLRNLAPACTKCNGSHKLQIDILHKKGGVRRRCFDPFGAKVAQVSLLKSRPLEGELKDLVRLPVWEIELIGDAEAIETWDEVYSIRKRYQFDVLDERLRGWLDHFALWASLEGAPPNDVEDLLKLLERYRLAVIQEGFSEIAFLKKAMFEMLAYQCRQGASADRVTAWLVSLLSPGTGAAALNEEVVAAA